MNAVQSKRRARGRPPGQDSPQLRESILDAAEELFSTQGYSSTSVREIAETTGVNPAMIHYYFGSKPALLQLVMERTLEPLAEALAEMKNAGQAPASEISRLLMKTLRQHPNLPVLMVREVMLPGGALQEHFLAHMAPRLGGALPAILKNEQDAGRVRQDLDPAITAMLLLALSVFPFIARDIAEQGLGITYDTRGLEKIEHHVARLLQEGITS